MTRDLRDGRGVLIRATRREHPRARSRPRRDVTWASLSSQKPFGLRRTSRVSVPRPLDGACGSTRWARRTGSARAPTSRRRTRMVNPIRCCTPEARRWHGRVPAMVTRRTHSCVPGISVHADVPGRGLFDTKRGRELRGVPPHQVRSVPGLSQRKASQHTTLGCFQFVPDLPMDRAWTDEELYERYGLDRGGDRLHRVYRSSRVDALT